jgi:phosphatidylserine/phosphatidylglycerophosphate/cardiolipin synthase-like enzyme
MNRNGVLAVVAVTLAIGWVIGRNCAAPTRPRAFETLSHPSGGANARTGCVVGVNSFFGSDCERALVGAIDGARDEVLVAIYSLTRRTISGSLARAAQRGVKVAVRYDEKSADEGHDMLETIEFLKRRKVRCEAVGFGDSRARMHHKFTVVDRRIVLTGSYNYTTTATEQNRENLVVIESSTVAAAYAAEFGNLRSR